MTGESKVLLEALNKEYDRLSSKESTAALAPSVLDAIAAVKRLNSNEKIRDLKFPSDIALFLMRKGCRIQWDNYAGYFYLKGNLLPTVDGFEVEGGFLTAINDNNQEDEIAALNFTKGIGFGKEDRVFSFYYGDLDYQHMSTKHQTIIN